MEINILKKILLCFLFLAVFSCSLFDTSTEKNKNVNNKKNDPVSINYKKEAICSVIKNGGTLILRFQNPIEITEDTKIDVVLIDKIITVYFKNKNVSDKIRVTFNNNNEIIFSFSFFDQRLIETISITKFKENGNLIENRWVKIKQSLPDLDLIAYLKQDINNKIIQIYSSLSLDKVEKASLIFADKEYGEIPIEIKKINKTNFKVDMPYSINPYSVSLYNIYTEDGFLYLQKFVPILNSTLHQNINFMAKFENATNSIINNTTNYYKSYKLECVFYLAEQVVISTNGFIVFSTNNKVSDTGELFFNKEFEFGKGNVVLKVSSVNFTKKITTNVVYEFFADYDDYEYITLNLQNKEINDKTIKITNNTIYNLVYTLFAKGKKTTLQTELINYSNEIISNYAFTNTNNGLYIISNYLCFKTHQNLASILRLKFNYNQYPLVFQNETNKYFTFNFLTEFTVLPSLYFVLFDVTNSISFGKTNNYKDYVFSVENINTNSKFSAYLDTTQIQSRVEPGKFYSFSMPKKTGIQKHYLIFKGYLYNEIFNFEFPFWVDYTKDFVEIKEIKVLNTNNVNILDKTLLKYLVDNFGDSLNITDQTNIINWSDDVCILKISTLMCGRDFQLTNKIVYNSSDLFYSFFSYTNKISDDTYSLDYYFTIYNKMNDEVTLTLKSLLSTFDDVFVFNTLTNKTISFSFKKPYLFFVENNGRVNDYSFPLKYSNEMNPDITSNIQNWRKIENIISGKNLTEVNILLNDRVIKSFYLNGGDFIKTNYFYVSNNGVGLFKLTYRYKNFTTVYETNFYFYLDGTKQYYTTISNIVVEPDDNFTFNFISNCFDFFVNPSKNYFKNSFIITTYGKELDITKYIRDKLGYYQTNNFDVECFVGTDGIVNYLINLYIFMPSQNNIYGNIYAYFNGSKEYLLYNNGVLNNFFFRVYKTPVYNNIFKIKVDEANEIILDKELDDKQRFYNTLDLLLNTTNVQKIIIKHNNTNLKVFEDINFLGFSTNVKINAPDITNDYQIIYISFDIEKTNNFRYIRNNKVNANANTSELTSLSDCEYISYGGEKYYPNIAVVNIKTFDDNIENAFTINSNCVIHSFFGKPKYQLKLNTLGYNSDINIISNFVYIFNNKQGNTLTYTIQKQIKNLEIGIIDYYIIIDTVMSNPATLYTTLSLQNTKVALDNYIFNNFRIYTYPDSKTISQQMLGIVLNFTNQINDTQSYYFKHYNLILTNLNVYRTVILYDSKEITNDFYNLGTNVLNLDLYFDSDEFKEEKKNINIKLISVNKMIETNISFTIKYTNKIEIYSYKLNDKEITFDSFNKAITFFKPNIYQVSIILKSFGIDLSNSYIVFSQYQRLKINETNKIIKVNEDGSIDCYITNLLILDKYDKLNIDTYFYDSYTKKILPVYMTNINNYFTNLSHLFLPEPIINFDISGVMLGTNFTIDENSTNGFTKVKINFVVSNAESLTILRNGEEIRTYGNTIGYISNAYFDTSARTINLYLITPIQYTLITKSFDYTYSTNFLYYFYREIDTPTIVSMKVYLSDNTNISFYPKYLNGYERYDFDLPTETKNFVYELKLKIEGEGVNLNPVTKLTTTGQGKISNSISFLIEDKSKIYIIFKSIVDFYTYNQYKLTLTAKNEDYQRVNFKDTNGNTLETINAALQNFVPLNLELYGEGLTINRPYTNIIYNTNIYTNLGFDENTTNIILMIYTNITIQTNCYNGKETLLSLIKNGDEVYYKQYVLKVPSLYNISKVYLFNQWYNKTIVNIELTAPVSDIRFNMLDKEYEDFNKTLSNYLVVIGKIFDKSYTNFVFFRLINEKRGIELVENKIIYKGVEITNYNFKTFLNLFDFDLNAVYTNYEYITNVLVFSNYGFLPIANFEGIVSENVKEIDREKGIFLYVITNAFTLKQLDKSINYFNKTVGFSFVDKNLNPVRIIFNDDKYTSLSNQVTTVPKINIQVLGCPIDVNIYVSPIDTNFSSYCRPFVIRNLTNTLFFRKIGISFLENSYLNNYVECYINSNDYYGSFRAIKTNGQFYYYIQKETQDDDKISNVLFIVTFSYSDNKVVSNTIYIPEINWKSNDIKLITNIVFYKFNGSRNETNWFETNDNLIYTINLYDKNFITNLKSVTFKSKVMSYGTRFSVSNILNVFTNYGYLSYQPDSKITYTFYNNGIIEAEISNYYLLDNFYKQRSCFKSIFAYKFFDDQDYELNIYDKDDNTFSNVVYLLPYFDINVFGRSFITYRKIYTNNITSIVEKITNIYSTVTFPTYFRSFLLSNVVYNACDIYYTFDIENYYTNKSSYQTNFIISNTYDSNVPSKTNVTFIINFFDRQFVTNFILYFNTLPARGGFTQTKLFEFYQDINNKNTKINTYNNINANQSCSLTLGDTFALKTTVVLTNISEVDLFAKVSNITSFGTSDIDYITNKSYTYYGYIINTNSINVNNGIISFDVYFILGLKETGKFDVNFLNTTINLFNFNVSNIINTSISGVYASNLNLINTKNAKVSGVIISYNTLANSGGKLLEGFVDLYFSKIELLKYISNNKANAISTFDYNVTFINFEKSFIKDLLTSYSPNIENTNSFTNFIWLRITNFTVKVDSDQLFKNTLTVYGGYNNILCNVPWRPTIVAPYNVANTGKWFYLERTYKDLSLPYQSRDCLMYNLYANPYVIVDLNDTDKDSKNRLLENNITSVLKRYYPILFKNDYNWIPVSTSYDKICAIPMLTWNNRIMVTGFDQFTGLSMSLSSFSLRSDMDVKVIQRVIANFSGNQTNYTNIFLLSKNDVTLQAHALSNNMFSLNVGWTHNYKDQSLSGSKLMYFSSNNIIPQELFLDTKSYSWNVGNSGGDVTANFYLILYNPLDLWNQDVFLAFFPNLRNSYHDYYGIYDESLPVSYYMFTNAFTLFDRWNTSHANSFSLYFASFVPDIEVVTAMKVLETTPRSDDYTYGILTNAYRMITNAKYYTFVKEIKLTYYTQSRGGSDLKGCFKKTVNYYDFSDINGTPLDFDNYTNRIIKDVDFMRGSTLLRNYKNTIKNNLTEDRVFYRKEEQLENYNASIYTTPFETIISNYSDILGSLEP